MFDLSDIPSHLIRDINDPVRCEYMVGELGSRRRKKLIPADQLVASSVLLPLFEKKGQTHILFIRRSDTVSHHKGEISFPGGRMERSDSSLIDTALRETHEEIGLSRERVRIIAELDDYVTPYNFHITPFAGFVDLPDVLVPDPSEVAEIICVPLVFFLNRQNYSAGFRLYNKKVYHLHFFRYGKHTIWGITGYIMHEFVLSLIRCFSE